MSEITPDDLPPINELDEFTAHIPELQTDTDVLAGTDGPANFQAQALANRTKYLKRILDAVSQELIEINQSVSSAQQSADASMRKLANGSDIVNPATFRTNLGLGSAATHDVQTSSTDATLNRILKLSANSEGAFGLGGNAIAIPAGSTIPTYFNNLPTGFYRAGSNIAGTFSPICDYSWIRHDANNGVLIAVGIGAIGAMAFRLLSAGGWSGWRTVWHDGNITLAGMYADRGSLGTTDLDTLFGSDYRGNWYQSVTATATPARNYPILSAGSLEIQYTGANIVGTVQRYTTHASNRIFIRYKLDSTGAWSAWAEIWTTANLVKQSAAWTPAANGEALIAGFAGGIGQNRSTTMPNSTLASDFRINGGWYVQVGQQSDVPSNGHSFNLFTHPSGNYGAQFWIDHRQAVPDIRYRVVDNNVVSSWHPLMTTDAAQTISGEKTFSNGIVDNKSNFGRAMSSAPVNLTSVSQLNNMRIGDILFVRASGSLAALVPETTGFWHIRCLSKSDVSVGTGSFEANLQGVSYNVYTGALANGSAITWRRSLYAGYNAVADSGGFWKTASPVINIYADGSFTATDEADGVNVERLSEGVYKITGCQGMHPDAAWNGIDGGISNPRCRNGMELTWNDFSVESDGSVIVRTYHRPHPDAISFARNEIDGYENGDSIDVPRGLFIQVRVNMPERAEPKPAIMSSNVYCNTISPAK